MILLALLSGGCSPGFRLDADPTCAEDPYPWGAGLTTHLVNGKRDGSFDYDPDGPMYDGVEGAYDLQTGDFTWTASYTGGGRRTVDEIDGFGTAWTDGDLDTSMDVVSSGEGIDDLTSEVRDVRLGCDLDRTVVDPDGAVRVYEGVFEDGGLTYSHTYAERGVVVTAEGELDDDGGWEEEVDHEEPEVTWTSTETGEPDGTVSRTFSRSFTSELIEGTWERDPDGTLDVETTRDPAEGQKETWAYTLDALGNGEGSLDVGPQDKHCDLAFVEGSCTQVACVELVDGPCDVPAPPPDWLVRL
jgi:hypothetical protein